jgi:pimeloyl-ACP methyl ester carboxylesterase
VEVEHRTVEANGISMHVAGAGSGPPVVLLHGFPELWYSWRHQLPALADAGFRAVAPDQRGYGRTDGPEAMEDYDILHLSADLTGLLDELGEERAVFVGHDWGAIGAWQLALLAPDRVRAVAALSVPFIPRSPVTPTELMRAVAGDRFFYILYFQGVGPADRELSRDPRASLARILVSSSGERGAGTFRRLPAEGTAYLETMAEPDGLPAWLSDEDLETYAAEFARTGFTGALNWYRNFDRNWKLTEHLAGAKVRRPALFVAGDRDPVLRMTPAAVMEGWVEDLRGSIILSGCGHWTQQERPDEVNRALIGFLSELV